MKRKPLPSEKKGFVRNMCSVTRFTNLLCENFHIIPTYTVKK